MKNVTLRADERLIEGARRRAEAEHTTLNNLFREWLAKYAGEPGLTADEIRKTVDEVRDFRVGRRLTREERNER
jgi:hypothetical protein